MRAISALLAAAVAAAACSADAPTPGGEARDAARDGLYRDFFEGKFDEAGHPIGAFVWQAETDCAPAIGYAAVEGWQVDAGEPAGELCGLPSGAIGRGRFTINVRALALEPLAAEDPAFEVVVSDSDGTELARETIDGARFATPLLYQNGAVTFTHLSEGAVDIRVTSAGAPIRIDYVELFRTRRGVAIAPTSGLLPADGAVQIEVFDPPDGWSLSLACGEVDLTDAVAQAIAAGDAAREDAEFRSLITAPAALLEACERPTRVTAKVVAGWTRASARVTYLDAPPPCAFDPASDRTRVLLTGFEPFPADAWHGNSSEQAVLGYDPSGHPDVQVMRMILPVEWQTAASWVADAIDRCDPDVVIGFGQGRSIVDVETTAYNLMDTSAVSGGVPDNRGLVHGGTPIDSDGPSELSTGLPVDDILADLAERGVDASDSDDPGRYICNNVFYGIVSNLTRDGTVGGFVHLPYLTQFDDDERALLQHAVDAAVTGALGRPGDE